METDYRTSKVIDRRSRDRFRRIRIGGRCSQAGGLKRINGDSSI